MRRLVDFHAVRRDAADLLRWLASRIDVADAAPAPSVAVASAAVAATPAASERRPWYKRWWAKALAGLTAFVLLCSIVSGGGSSDDASQAVSDTSASETASKKRIPDVSGLTPEQAWEKLARQGFDAARNAEGDGWLVTGTTPKAGALRPSGSTVALDVERDPAVMPNVVAVGVRLDEAEAALAQAGYRTDQWTVQSDDGSAVENKADWDVSGVEAGVLTVHNRAADERAAAEAAAQAQAQAQAEAAAQAQAEAQAQAATPAPSQDTPSADAGGATVHGGAWCNGREGQTGVNEKGTPLTCRVASDGRLRWMR